MTWVFLYFMNFIFPLTPGHPGRLSNSWARATGSYVIFPLSLQAALAGLTWDQIA